MTRHVGVLRVPFGRNEYLDIEQVNNCSLGLLGKSCLDFCPNSPHEDTQLVHTLCERTHTHEDCVQPLYLLLTARACGIELSLLSSNLFHLEESGSVELHETCELTIKLSDLTQIHSTLPLQTIALFEHCVTSQSSALADVCFVQDFVVNPVPNYWLYLVTSEARNVAAAVLPYVHGTMVLTST